LELRKGLFHGNQNARLVGEINPLGNGGKSIQQRRQMLNHQSIHELSFVAQSNWSFKYVPTYSADFFTWIL